MPTYLFFALDSNFHCNGNRKHIESATYDFTDIIWIYAKSTLAIPLETFLSLKSELDF